MHSVRLLRLVASLCALVVPLSFLCADERKLEMLTASVRVTNEAGEPVSGATVKPSGMRTITNRGSHWSWSEERHGALPVVKTDANGMAQLPYPKYVAEKREIGEVTWWVEHSDYVRFREDRKVTDDPAEITLQSGFRIAVTAVNAATDELITSDLYGTISGSNRTSGWEQKPNGILISGVYGYSQPYVRIVHLPEHGPRLWSEMIRVQGDEGKERVFLRNVKMQAGTVVKGNLDGLVPRPVKNGRVAAFIINPNDPDDYEAHWSWMDFTEINPDGTFEFASLPRGEIVQLIVTCDGWISSLPQEAKVEAAFPLLRDRGARFQRPQVFMLDEDKVTPVVKMTATVECRVTILKPNGDSLSGADVYMWPNQAWFHGGSQIIGAGGDSAAWLRLQRQGGDATEAFIGGRFSAVSDEHGIAVIRNLPASGQHWVAASHDQFEHPVADRRRNTAVELKPDEVAEVTIHMQPKGTEVVNE